MIRRRRKRDQTAARAGLLLALFACAASACSSTPTASPSSTSTTRPPASTSSSVPTTTVGTAGHVVINGRSVRIPDERGDQPVRTGTDVGEQILIFPKRIEPHLLFCEVGFRLTFTNLTTVPQRLHFVNDGGWWSPSIPPGGVWHFTPKNGISFYYVTNTHLQATFQASTNITGNP
jgi:hypothetical protein